MAAEEALIISGCPLMNAFWMMFSWRTDHRKKRRSGVHYGIDI